jgi:hypothetical protein
MPSRRPELRRGRIVWAVIRDRNGVPKERPLIILTATDDITPDAPIEVMAITTTFTDPPPPNHEPLPWHPQGRVVTRLRKRSAAVLTWVGAVQPNEIIQFHGDVPPGLMTSILSRLPGRPDASHGG